MSRAVVALVLVAALSGCGDRQPVPAQSDTAQARWFSWALGRAEEQGVLQMYGDDYCAVNQPADVWFLVGTAGNIARRSCRIPAGRRIVAPVGIRMTTDPVDCEDEAMAYARPAKATLNGRPVALERVDKQLISVQTAPGNRVQPEGGLLERFVCGSWLAIDALSPGKYVLQLDGYDGQFDSTSATISLEVVADTP